MRRVEQKKQEIADAIGARACLWCGVSLFRDVIIPLRFQSHVQSLPLLSSIDTVDGLAGKKANGVACGA